MHNVKKTAIKIAKDKNFTSEKSDWLIAANFLKVELGRIINRTPITKPINKKPAYFLMFLKNTKKFIILLFIFIKFITVDNFTLIFYFLSIIIKV